jgi:DNA invertase Pin-like site-specific DNA recombinase
MLDPDKAHQLTHGSPEQIDREFDVVTAWSVDRLGGSLQHLVSFLNELQAKGIDLSACISKVSIRLHLLE